jgi:hypothetical protein
LFSSMRRGKTISISSPARGFGPLKGQDSVG